MAKPEETSENDNQDAPSNNDFVIREGFPALRLPGGKAPWIHYGDEPIPRHTFWAGRVLRFTDIDLLRQDCETVFSARARENDQAYSAGVTYFCPVQLKPRCALEALALSIFDVHTRDLEDGVVVPEQSGAEWWTLVLDDDKKQTEEENDDDEGDEVGLHFDADYGLEDQAPNLLLHPRLATVTYLTDYGAPTVIFDKRSPRPDDPDKKSLEGDITRGWLSHPKIGKHVAFDGRLLHGAPATFFPAASAQESRKSPPKRARTEKRRITVLVNVWINHCPLDAEPLEEEMCEQLKSHFSTDDTAMPFSWHSLDLNRLPVCGKYSLSASPSDPAGEEEFVLCNRIVIAKYGASMEDLHKVSRVPDLVELELGTGVLSLKVGGSLPDGDSSDA